MQGPGLVAASDAGSGSSLRATPATAPRQRKPGRWRRIPRDKPSLRPSGTPDFVPPGFGLRSILPTPDPMPDPRKAREQQVPLNTFKLVVVQKGSKEEEDLNEQRRLRWLQTAKELDESSEDSCETEEAKAEFRKYKAEFASWYRKLANTKPEDVVLNHIPPSDTQEEHLSAEDMEMEARRSGWPVCPQAKHFAKLALDHYNSTKKMHKFKMATVLLSKCFLRRMAQLLLT